MKVFINAVSVSEGGALIVLKKMLGAMCELAPDVVWYVAAPSQTLAVLPSSSSIVKLSFD